MSSLEVRLTVNDGSTPAYEVRVNDGGPDGGSTCDLYIGGSPAGLSTSQLDTAVQAFANALAANPGYTVRSVTRLVVDETPL